MALIIGIGILLIIVLIVTVYRSKQANNISGTTSSWREDNADGSFSIYDKQGVSTVVKIYEGGERYIDGHRCSTADDMARWYVKKGFGEGLERRLLEIENELRNLNTDAGDSLFHECNERYDIYRSLCMEIGMYNWFIGDHTRFIPTKEQIELEEARKESVATLYQKWQKRMRENRVIIDYLERAPRKHSSKNALISDLSGSDEQNKKTIQNAYRRLLKAGILGEKNDNGTIETRIIVRRSNAATKLPTLPPSTYQADIYANIRRNDIYKVDYTVGPPEEIDRINNTCCFTSKSSGKKYATSLERCSCPAFCKGYACKHMLALALSLGYFDRSSVTR